MTTDRYFQKRIEETSSVQQICAPLKELGICGFFYVRIYNDGTYINLSTHLDWTEFFMKNFLNGKYSNEAVSDHYFISQGISLWHLNKDNIIWHEGEEIFGLGNGISICNVHDDYHDLYCFHSVKGDERINEFYLKNIDLLYQFPSYFEVKAADLIKNGNILSRDHKIHVPEIYRNNYSNIHPKNTSIDVNKYVDLITKDGFIVNIGNRKIKLTKREMVVLHWTIQGKSSEEIASIINIKKKTVEVYHDELKKKFNCFKVARLVALAVKIGLDRILEMKYL